MHLNSNGHAEYGGNTVTSPQNVHVYPVEWASAFIKWFIDGAQFHEINIASGTGGTEEFQKPFFLLLNLTVAGNWPGQTVDKSKLPATMAGDCGRGYQLGNPPPPLANSVATVYRDCNGAVILPVDDYNLGALQSRGILSDDTWRASESVGQPACELAWGVVLVCESDAPANCYANIIRS